MEPRIGRSIVEGFRAANRSVVGMAVYAASWLLVGGLVIGGVALTSPPQEVFEAEEDFGAGLEEELPAPPAEAAPPGAPADAPPAATSIPEPAETAPADGADAAAPEPAAQPATEPADVFTELGEAEDITPAPPAALPSPAALDESERDRLFNEWVGRSWPILLLCVLLLVVGGAWLNAAQTGYLVQRVRTGQATLADFRQSGNRSFVAMLGAWLLSTLGAGALLLAVTGLGFVFQGLANLLPDWLLSVLAMLLILLLIAALVWLIVRLSFWFVALVADRSGPLRGLKASFATTRRRWWKVAGLGVAISVLSYAALLPSAALEWLGNRTGGPAGIVLGVLGSLLGAAVGLYVGFAVLSAFIRFYEDTKTPSA